MDKIIIQGLDLKTDPGVQKICDAYNSSSGSTRSVLYVLMLINVLSFIAVLNTHLHNWTQDRIEQRSEKIRSLLTHTRSLADSDNLEALKVERDQDLKSKVENYQNIKLPILGNAFDINNLCIVSGLSFIILLIILRFTLTREKNNLRIALQSISERYTPDSDEKEFEYYLRNCTSEKEQHLHKINAVRRKHHYNYLSMNEIYNLPPLESSENSLQNTWLGKVINTRLYYFSYFIYFLIILNDLSTFRRGIETSPSHTIFSTVLGILGLCSISYLSKSCNWQKQIITNLFNDFYDNDYKYVRIEYSIFRQNAFGFVAGSFLPLLKAARILLF